MHDHGRSWQCAVKCHGLQSRVIIFINHDFLFFDGHRELNDFGLTFGDLIIDTASHSVKVAGQEAPLTPKEFDLLVFLVNNKGIALSREKILQQVWNYDYYGEDRTVDTHIKMLRGHLGSCG